jgi:hypothetical protein
MYGPLLFSGFVENYYLRQFFSAQKSEDMKN